MKNSKKKRKTKNNKKKKYNFIQTFIILIIAIVIFIMLTTIYQLIKHPTNIFILENGTIAVEEETEGLIIREEYIVKGQNNKNGILPIKTEGQKAAKGEIIFRYYSESENNIKAKIEEVENKIQQIIADNEEVSNSDIALLNIQIKSKLQGTHAINELQKIREIKADINADMTKRIQLVGDASNNSELRELTKQKETYEKELTRNSEYINATLSGVVSYRIDDYEEKLPINNFDYINKEFIKNVNIKAGQIIATSNEAGKIINNFEAYVATNVKSDSAGYAKIGDKVELQFSNSEKIDAEIVYINMENDSSKTVVFKITKKIEDLIKYRKISINIIWKEAKGFKVPNSALITENGKPYLIKNRNGYKTKVLVKIKQQNKSYSIIDNYTDDELLQLGLSKEEIKKKDNISLYDEIILNPSSYDEKD